MESCCTFAVLFLFGVLTLHTVTGGKSWYEGCYHDDTLHGRDEARQADDDPGDDEALQGETGTDQNSCSVVECCRKCYLERYEYAAVQSVDLCRCHGNKDDLRLLSNGLCLDKNTTGDYLPLPCGQTDTSWSVYRSAGPYIVDTSVVMDTRWVVKDRLMAIEVVTDIASFVNVSSEFPLRLDASEMLMEWWFDDDVDSGSRRLRAEGSRVYGRITHTFTRVGNNTFYINVTNVLSQARIERVVEVVESEPRDLEISLLQPIAELPSCIPESLWIPNGPSYIQVFQDVPFQIEASVAIGTNLTFVFELDDVTSDSVRALDLDPHCRSWNCSAVVKEFVLNETGPHQLNISVYNQFGRLQKTWTIIVVDGRLNDPTFMLTTDARSVVASREPVRFVASVEITSRIGAILVVDFDDGVIQHTELKDTNSTSMALDSDHGDMMVVASYGQGCRLKVEFEHHYDNQGVYQPTITVKYGNKNVTEKFRGLLQVVNPLYGARLKSDQTVAVGESTQFLVHLMSASVNVSYNWTVLDNDDLFVASFTSHAAQMTYSFSTPGVYQIMCIASNVISDAQAVTSIVVQEAISDVQLTCTPSTCIELDQPLLCVASIAHGTHSKFAWKFPSGHVTLMSTSQKAGVSVANFTFSKPHRYNISVQAYNDISQVKKSVADLICVQDPVLCVSIQSFGPVLYSNATEFEIMVTPERNGVMTFLMFDFMFGRVLHPWRSLNVQYYANIFYTKYTFDQPGVHDVTATAYNNISRVSHSIKVLVLRVVPRLEVKVIGPAMVGMTTVLQVIPKWPSGVTDSLIYQWNIDNYTIHGMGSTIVRPTFHSIGRHHVNVTASNYVDNSTATLIVDVVAPSSVGWYLSHDTFVPVNLPVDFTLQGELVAVTTVRNVEYDGPQYIQHTVDNYRWSHQFSEAGLYPIIVTMTTGTTVESLILVQEDITGLQLTGPRIVKIEKLFKDHFWEVSTDSGTNIMYQWSMWSLSNGRSGANITGATYGVMDKFRRRVESPGLFNLTVVARNEISHSQASMLITISYPVTKVIVMTRPLALGHVSYINITIQGADNFNVYVDFGDNSSTEISTAENFANIFRLSDLSFKVVVSHNYTSKGVYKIDVNVSNPVSSVQRTGEVLVGEPITGIALHTLSAAIILLHELVSVTATVGTGNDLVFEWDFSEGPYKKPTVRSEGNTSTATNRFSIIGSFPVTVSVTNHLYVLPFLVTLDLEFQVILKVDKLSLETINLDGKVKGAPLQGRPPNLSTPDVHFKAQCEGSDVTFDFNFGEGVTKSVIGVANAYYMYMNMDIMDGVVSHRYTEEGVYNISVTARNSLSNMTTYLATPFYVQLPAQGLQLADDVILTPFGEQTTFSASVMGGTNFTFDWKFGDQSDKVCDAGPVVTHEYTQTGRYIVTVIAKNNVSQLTQTAEVMVLHRLQGVQLNLSKRIVATNEVIQFSAVTFPDSATVGYFEWNFGLQEKAMQSYDPETTHAYKISNRHIVTVTTHNSISHVESEPIEVIVQSPVSENIEIRYDTKKMHHIVNENSTFSVYYFNGYNLTFTWDFGDGSLNKSTRNRTVQHVYNSTKEYVITVWARNLVSSAEARDNIFVLDKKCVKPEFVIHGEFSKGDGVSIHIQRSRDLYVEAELKRVNCDYTNATVYQWTFYNASSEQEIKLKTVDDEVLRKKMLRIPARVLAYGTYNLRVTVGVRGTIVHARRQTRVRVDPTPLLCTIRGSLYRGTRRSNVIILDGSNSVDPDTNDNTSLRFNWTCFIGYDEEKSCFSENLTDTVSMDTARISFPGSWLREDENEFMMKLMLMAEDRDSVECTQVIYINDQLQLNIYCPQCEQPLVNWDRPLSFQAILSSCDKLDVVYEWTLYKVPFLSQTKVDHRYRPCAVTRQQSHLAIVRSNHTTPKQSPVTVAPPPDRNTDTTTTTRAPRMMFEPLEDPSEGRTRGKRRANSRNRPVQEDRESSGQHGIIDTADLPPMAGKHNVLNMADIPHIDSGRRTTQERSRGRTSRRRMDNSQTLDMSDIPHMDTSRQTLDMSDIPRMDTSRQTLDMSDIPRMDTGRQTLDLSDIPRMDTSLQTLDMSDIPRMHTSHQTVDISDIPRMHTSRQTVDRSDIPHMDTSRQTVDGSDIPHMDTSRQTVDRSDIPRMDTSRQKVDMSDIPRMDTSRQTVDMSDIPHMDTSRQTVDRSDIPRMDTSRQTVDRSDIPRMDTSRQTVDMSDIPRMDTSHHTLDMSDIPRMDTSRQTVDMSDIPRMDTSRQTVDMSDIPRMDTSRQTVDMSDIPRMDTSRQTVDMSDFPRMDTSHQTLDMSDIPRMDASRQTLDMSDIPRMDTSRQTVDMSDIPRMDTSRQTVDMSDIPRMDTSRQTVDRSDIPRMDTSRQTLDMSDIPRMDKSRQTVDRSDIPRMDTSRQTVDRSDIPRMDTSHQTVDRSDIPRMYTSGQTLDRSDSPRMDTSRQTVDRSDIPRMDTSRQTVDRSDIPRMDTSHQTVDMSDIPRMDTSSQTLDMSDIPRMDTSHQTVDRSDIPPMDTSHQTLDMSDIPRMDTSRQTLDRSDIPRMDTSRQTVDMSDIPRMDTSHQTLDMSDIPRMDTSRQTVDRLDIPRMDTSRQTVDMSDIPRMDASHQTVDMSDIPRMDTSRRTVDMSDIPRMDTSRQTLDRSDIPRMYSSGQTLDRSDIPRMATSRRTVDRSDIPRMDTSHQTVDMSDIPRMDTSRQTVDRSDIPRMDTSHQTVDRSDIPRMDTSRRTVDMSDIPRMDTSRPTVDRSDIPRMDTSHQTVDMSDIPHMDTSHQTLDMSNIPRMDTSHQTLDMSDIPRMDTSHQTVDMSDIPHIDTSHQTLDMSDIPRMDTSHQTVDMSDIPHMDTSHQTVDMSDIPRMDTSRQTVDRSDIPRMDTSRRSDIPHMDTSRRTVDVSDIPRMDTSHQTVDIYDIPRMDSSRQTVDRSDIPRMDTSRQTVDMSDIPRMDTSHQTVDMSDIPHIDTSHQTVDRSDIPRMDTSRQTLDMSDIPRIDTSRQALDMSDIPRMDTSRQTVDRSDIPRMDTSRQAVDRSDIPRMDTSHQTVDMSDIPRMDTNRQTVDRSDIPRMDTSRPTLDMSDMPRMDTSRRTVDNLNILRGGGDTSRRTLDMSDILRMDTSSLSRMDTTTVNPNTVNDHQAVSNFPQAGYDIFHPFIEENTHVTSSRFKPPPTLFEPEEGNPGEEGSSVARNPAYENDILEEGAGGRRPDIGGMGDTHTNTGIHKIAIPTLTPTVTKNPHILEHKAVPMIFVWNTTLTGLNKRSLVIKPSSPSIEQGSTYIMHVKVTAKDGSAEGEAKAQFTVNQSPRYGDCSIKPDSGLEMETEFKMFCWEWKDVEEHLPLWYEVSYNQREDDLKYIIYRGLQSSINFKLPAGNPANNHQVYVYITILDGLSGRTQVCFAPLTVRPHTPVHVTEMFGATTPPEEVIYYEALGVNGSIVRAQEQGYEHSVKVLIRYLATRLNRLPQEMSMSTRRRQQIRHHLLEILKQLSIRDELELIQTLQALSAVTQVTSELSRLELDVASAVFRSIVDRASELYSQALTPTNNLLTLAVTTASNMIQATVQTAPLDKSDMRWFYRSTMSSSISTLDQLLKNELMFHVIGEEAIKLEADFVTMIASRFSVTDRPVLRIDQSKFTLPKDMSVILEKENCSLDDHFSPNRDCFQVHFTKFHGNPYIFDYKKKTKIDSEVRALNIYTCDGELVHMNDLQDDNMVTMEIPQLPAKEETTPSDPQQHRLERTSMNLHQFNVSRDRQHQSLNLIINLVPAVEERLFPIAFMIGYNNPPSPDAYLLRREIDPTARQFKLFLPDGFFNVSGSYYIGVVDGDFNSGRRRPGEATQRNYTVTLWWARCLYWDPAESMWSSEGCWTMEDSSLLVTRCRCNHLSAFASHFDLVPNELSFISVDDFFPNHKNPVTVTLIGVILCIYVILMVICHRADLHDAKKGGITYLQDNTITDQQRFEVTVETGFRKGAGTTAKISLILHGEEGMSETRELITDERRPLFERNSRDKFILTLPDSIGKIWKVQIWHNNSGQSPSWYLSRVIVKDLNNGNIYFFLSEKWLAVEEDDGKVEREFMALEGNLGVRNVFWVKGTQYMADYHLWTSLFTHPSPSQFTRTQRLTCCLTLLSMYMCLNAMWYKRAPSEVRGEFGLLDLSLRNVTVGAICCAVAIPVNLFLAFLFRRSKKQRTTSDVDRELVEEKDKEYPSGKPDGPTPDDDEDSEAVQPVMTYSILDQSILNWPSIQDWAQKQWIKRQHSTMSMEDTTSSKATDNAAQQGQTTLTPTHILHKRVIGSETDQASSGFEDSNSTDPRPQRTISSQASSVKYKAPSVSSSGSQKFAVLSNKKSCERRLYLPHWCQYIAWTLCALITLGSSIITILYGFRFGHTKSTMWLHSLYFSFVVCVFISHPLMICITVVYTAIKYRNNPSILDHCEEGSFGEQAKLEILRWKKERAKENPDQHEEIERGVAARQRSRYLRFARPPQEKQLIEARKKIMKEKKAMSLVSNSVAFAVMFFLLCVMAYGKDIVTSPFYLNEAIKNSLLRSGPVKFNEISRPHDWYNWSQTTMINTLYANRSLLGNSSKGIQNFALHGSSVVIGQGPCASDEGD